MRSTTVVVVVSAVMGLAGCGGGAEGEPLISTTLTGQYAGTPFTPSYGFATVYMDTNIIGVGDGEIHCGSPSQNDPPPGTNAIIQLPAVDVGSYPGVFVQLFHNVDQFEGIGSIGDVTITASSAASLAGTVAYTFTNEGQTYGLSGSFEVIRCAN